MVSRVNSSLPCHSGGLVIVPPPKEDSLYFLWSNADLLSPLSVNSHEISKIFIMPLTYSAVRKVFSSLKTCFDEPCLLGPYQASPRMFWEAGGVGITVRLNGSQKYGTTEIREAQHQREGNSRCDR